MNKKAKVNREKFLKGEPFYVPGASWGNSTFRAYVNDEGECRSIYGACKFTSEYIGGIDSLGHINVKFSMLWLKRKMNGCFRFEDMKFVPIDKWGRIIETS
jgi:hypothetical protein